MSRTLIDLAEDLELTAWPGIASAHRNGWLVRMAGGFTGRANSATALIEGADLDDVALADLERFYGRHGLPAMVRITPKVAPGLDARLVEHGYTLRTPTEMRVAAIDPALRADPAVVIDAALPGGWIAVFGQINGRTDFKATAMATIIANILAPTGFARLIEDGRTRAVGLGVVDQGHIVFESIAVDPHGRGRGLGRRLMASLMAWGYAAGARHAMLNVQADNEPATRLYTGLGFTKFAGYHYRVQPSTTKPLA